jgi:hypothetical protein
MKHRRDCKCPCHQGGVAIHVVPCCDGMPLGLVSKRKQSRIGGKQSKKNPSIGRQQPDKA